MNDAKKPQQLRGVYCCTNCPNVELTEREVSCWKCGKGEMVYRRINHWQKPQPPTRSLAGEAAQPWSVTTFDELLADIGTYLPDEAITRVVAGKIKRWLAVSTPPVASANEYDPLKDGPPANWKFKDWPDAALSPAQAAQTCSFGCTEAMINTYCPDHRPIAPTGMQDFCNELRDYKFETDFSLDKDQERAAAQAVAGERCTNPQCAFRHAAHSTELTGCAGAASEPVAPDWEKNYKELTLASARMIEQWDQEAADNLKNKLAEKGEGR